MKRRLRYGRILSDDDLSEIKKQASDAKDWYLRNREERKQSLLHIYRKKGLDKFCDFIVAVLDSRTEYEFSPDLRYSPDLGERLKTACTKGLRVSRVGDGITKKNMRVEFPLHEDPKKYLDAIYVYQDYFNSMESNTETLVKYIVDEYGSGRKYSDIANELNEALMSWASGQSSELDMLDLDSFLKKRGITPEKYELFDSERIRRLVKYHWTGK